MFLCWLIHSLYNEVSSCVWLQSNNSTARYTKYTRIQGVHVYKDAMYVKRNIVLRSLNQCDRATATCINYISLAYVCGFSYGSRKERALILLSSVVCLVLQYFSTLSHKRRDFRTKVTEHKMCSDFPFKCCLKPFSFWEELSEKWLQMYIDLHVK
jgi:hypothetical protein